MAKDYYQILGISKTASQEEVKKAFHKLAHTHHPNKGGDENKFKEINEAYQTLSNKEKRAQYDQFGSASGGNGAPSGWAWGTGSNEAGFDFDMGDLSDVMEGFFGFGSKGNKKDVKGGRDIEIDLEITLEEVFKGVEKKFSLKKFISCNRCHGAGAEPGTKIKECFSCRGAGYVQQIRRTVIGSFTQKIVCPECGGEGYRPEKPCNVCNGEGRLKGEEEITVFIPAGVDNNQIIKLGEKGENGRRNGKAGDLYLRIFVKQHKTFKRKGDDLLVEVPISFSQAVIGDEIKISLLDEKEVLLKIPSGIESGKILRVSGKGLPHFSGGGSGSLYVELNVKIPKKLSKKQRELIEELKKEGI